MAPLREIYHAEALDPSPVAFHRLPSVNLPSTTQFIYHVHVNHLKQYQSSVFHLLFNFPSL